MSNLYPQYDGRRQGARAATPGNVVHLMPTAFTNIAIKHSMMEHIISPRVPRTIPGDKDTQS
ncbi:hypothetical protein EYF80_019946 [Liparis tanakae]|uniref:Uncharacterized protein n=1 Tax=Liparis tanakae TaxID=230148 RepID=A0A4Z2HW22_9TELE|nr:hypothetical protein EYF80_019946 [Liparis tanakae]